MYETDIRHIVRTGSDADADRRLRAFLGGWTDAANKRVYQDAALSRVTWRNLGWRMGQVLGDRERQYREQLFELLADLQVAQRDESRDEPDVDTAVDS